MLRTHLAKLSSSSLKSLANSSYLKNPNPKLLSTHRCFSSTVGAHQPSTSFTVQSCPSREDVKIPVRAYFFNTSIDLRGLVNENKVNFIPSTTPVTNNVVLKFADAGSGAPGTLNDGGCSYMSVFPYGSIVLFNIPDHDIYKYLNIVERHTSGFPKKDNGYVLCNKSMKYEVIQKPNLPVQMQGGFDYIMLQELNPSGIQIIGSIIGQSVALKHYIRQVDGVMFGLSKLNYRKNLSSKKVNKLDGKANSSLADAVLKLVWSTRNSGPMHTLRVGLFESLSRSNSTEYAEMWEYLRSKFALSKRYAGLDFMFEFKDLNLDLALDELIRKDVSPMPMLVRDSSFTVFYFTCWDPVVTFLEDFLGMPDPVRKVSAVA
ncbi:hypothetical protein MKW94_002618 [Papaver nudicaule]|uniref:DUF155 domain-containing protein n=1 Tax=Papaver nudicaule TaxID=74823 RepID=A0AA41S0A7_PAPNU|nr:hypothetical protein [Papaver nudicaule]